MRGESDQAEQTCVLKFEVLAHEEHVDFVQRKENSDGWKRKRNRQRGRSRD